MELNRNERIVLKKLGYNEIPSDENKQLELYEKLEDLLMNEGINDKEEVNSIGLACESLLDKLSD